MLCGAARSESQPGCASGLETAGCSPAVALLTHKTVPTPIGSMSDTLHSLQHQLVVLKAAGARETNALSAQEVGSTCGIFSTLKTAKRCSIRTVSSFST